MRSSDQQQKLCDRCEELCDRCGNDFQMGKHMIHFPFVGVYVELCHICIRGLMFDFYLGVKSQTEGLDE